MKIYPTKEYLLECFDYNKETGELFWKKRPPEHFDNAKCWRWWNKIFAGKFSGTISKSGECSIKIDNKKISRAIIIWIINTGKQPERKLYKKNENKLDDRYCNLTIKPTNSNGITRSKNGYDCRLYYKGRHLNLGCFKTEYEAKNAYEKALKDIEKGYFFAKTRRNKTNRKGVTAYKKGFISRINFNNKKVNLGYFDTLIEASISFQKAKKEIEEGTFIPKYKPRANKFGFTGVSKDGNKFKATFRKEYLGLFNTPEEAHAAYLNAKNPPLTFDDGLDILRQIKKQSGYLK